MKALILIRHAKSSWEDAAVSDKHRPLNRRGMQDAPKMGRRLAERGWQPELVLSSPATRAIATARIIAEQLGYPVNDIITLDRLYDADSAQILGVVRELDDATQEVMLVGHNPGISELADRLTDGEVNHIPTCGAVAIRFDVRKWSAIADARPVRVEFDRPKDKDKKNESPSELD